MGSKVTIAILVLAAVLMFAIAVWMLATPPAPPPLALVPPPVIPPAPVAIVSVPMPVRPRPIVKYIIQRLAPVPVQAAPAPPVVVAPAPIPPPSVPASSTVSVRYVDLKGKQVAQVRMDRRARRPHLTHIDGRGRVGNYLAERQAADGTWVYRFVGRERQ